MNSNTNYFTDNSNTFKDNQKLVYSIVNRYKKNSFDYKTNIDWDEIEQVGLIALFKATQMYNKDKGSFKNYAITAIKNAIKRQLIFDNKTIDDVGIESAYKIPVDNIDLNDVMDDEYLIKELYSAIDKLAISDKSKEVLYMRAKGYTFQAIADRVGISLARVGQIIQRQAPKLRARLSKFM